MKNISPFTGTRYKEVKTSFKRAVIVQCKHYRNPVPPEPIRALWGCKDDFGANEVILVASSGITQSGADFISNKPNFKVLNLDDIIGLSEQVNSSSKVASSNNYGRRLDI